MPQGTLTGAGWVLPADSIYQSNVMTSAGRVAPSGSFVAAKVRAITGGSSPQLQIWNHKTMIRTVSATPGATIDQRSAPDVCPNGIFLVMTGNPGSFDVEVLWK